MEQYNNVPKNKIVELKNKTNQKRGVKMEGNTNKNQNNYMGGDFEYFMNQLPYKERNNPKKVAKAVKKTANIVYKEETDVGGDGYIKLCQQIVIENVSSDILDDVIKVLWR